MTWFIFSLDQQRIPVLKAFVQAVLFFHPLCFSLQHPRHRFLRCRADSYRVRWFWGTLDLRSSCEWIFCARRVRPKHPSGERHLVGAEDGDELIVYCASQAQPAKVVQWFQNCHPATFSCFSFGKIMQRRWVVVGGTLLAWVL